MMRHALTLLAGAGLLCACRTEFVTGRFIEASSASATSTSNDETTSSTTTGWSASGTEGEDTSGSEVDGLNSTSSGSSSSTSGTTTGSGEDTFIDTTGTPTCEAPSGHTVCDFGGGLFEAIGLGCNGNEDDSTPVYGRELVSVDPDAVRLAQRYGNSSSFVPTEGGKFVVLSNGNLPMPGPDGRISIDLGVPGMPGPGNGNPDGTLPPGVSAAPGSEGAPFENCDGVGDCSNSLDTALQAAPSDLVYLRFTVDVPAGTFGYKVDLAWFSAEFPSKVGQQSDLFVWWQSSEMFTGNVAHMSDGSAMSATSLASTIVDYGFVGNSGALEGTGFNGVLPFECSVPGGTYSSCPRGGATGWMQLNAPVVDGESVTMTVALFDVGGADIDTTVLLDNWLWDCDGCTLGEDCGVRSFEELER